MSWKLALYDFIHCRNQMETDYDWNALRHYVTDERYLDAVRTLQERRKTQHRARALTPVKSETRLRIKHMDTAAGAVVADTELRQRFDYKIGDSKHFEERIVTERMTIRTVGGRWKVAGVKAWNAGSGPEAIPSFGERDRQEEQREGEQTEGPTIPEGFLEGNLSGGRTGPYLNRDLIPPFSLSPEPRQVPYRRERARLYAETWWNAYNPEYLRFDVDCSNFVSQCLVAGGAPMNYTGRRDSGWWYHGRSGGRELWSYSWAVANALRLYLAGKHAAGLRAEQVGSAAELQLGDVISYCWDGDGRYGHSTIVAAFDAKGMPLVNAHTVNSRNRYWDYKDSYAWTERTMYRFFHIPDYL